MQTSKYHRRRGNNSNTVICDTCNVRIPVNYPKLFCSLCDKLKHARCQNLTKQEANEIVNNRATDWVCFACISSILPVNAHCRVKREENISRAPKYKQKCGACLGYPYSPNNVNCNWCLSACHKNCVKGKLGCLKCCESMMPPYNYNIWELYDEPSLTNNGVFNPYDSKKLATDIGDTVCSEIEQNCVWQEISEFMINCKYRQLKDTAEPKPNELKILNLNIRSLYKHIDSLRDNLDNLQKYDVVCFNETMHDLTKLPNGIDSLLLEGFLRPKLRPPNRKSNKGGDWQFT